MKRRNFLARIALGIAGVAGTLAVLSYFRQFFPRPAGERRRIPLGDPRRFPVDTFTYLDEHKLYVYRDHEGIKAVSAVCTHLGCILEKSMEGFECPCHGSCYNDKGEVLSGPAPRNLAWYSVSREADGRIMIHPGKTVSPDEKFISS